MERAFEAFQLNTLPRFVFRDGGGNWRNYEWDAQFIGGQGLLNPKRWIAEENKTAQIPLELNDDDVFTFYILSNAAYHNARRLGSTLDQVYLALDLSPEEIMVFDRLSSEIEHVPNAADPIDSRQRVIMMIQAERANFKGHMEEQQSWRAALDKIPPWTVEDFSATYKNNVYRLQINKTLLDIFNSLKPEGDVTLITARNYYKMRPDEDIPVEYPEDDETLFIYVKRDQVVLRRVPDTFLKPEYDLVVKENRELLDLLRRALRPVSERLISNTLNGQFRLILPALSLKEAPRLNKIVWQDMVMNNEAVAQEYIVDEHLDTARRTTIPMIRFHADTKIPLIVSDYHEYNARGEAEYGLLVRLNNVPEAADAIRDLQDSLRFLAEIYQVTARKIAADYNRLLSDPIDLAIPTLGKRKPKDIAPELFPNNYTRLCQYMPDIISEREAKDLEAKGYQVMLFPKDSNKKQYLFTCAQHDGANNGRIYPGLRQNKKENKGEYPLLPCCYKEDHRTKKNTAYRSYYEEEEIRAPAGGAKPSRHIITNKLLKFGQTGKLPNELRAFFLAMGQMGVNRAGVTSGPSSLLDCILCETREGFAAKSEQTRFNVIQEERARLAKLGQNRLNSCLQEITRAGMNKAREALNNPAVFLDASLFYSLVESEYKCKLVVFERGDFKHPYHHGAFLRTPRPADWPIVIVYENLGGEMELQSFPQYELFEGVQQRERIYQLYTSALESWVVEGEAVFPVRGEGIAAGDNVPLGIILSQHVNEGGHAYALDVRITGATHTFILQTPLPPREVPVSQRVYPSDRQEQLIRIHQDRAVRGEFYPLQAAEEGAAKSVLERFVDTRAQAQIVVQNALHMKSVKGKIVYSISPRDVVKPSDRDKWLKGPLMIPDGDTGPLVSSAVDTFAMQRPREFEEYRDLQYVPFNYQSILDFNQSSEYTIQSTRAEKPPIAAPFQLDKPRGQKSFFLQHEGVIYFAVLIRSAPARGRILVWNTRQVLKVNDEPHLYLSFKSRTIFYYKLAQVTAL